MRRDAELNRERLVQAAREMFAERGLRVTLADIANRAGVGVGTLYRNFGSREALFDGLFEELYDESLEKYEEIHRRALDCPDAWLGFVQYLQGALETMINDRGLWILMFQRSNSAKDRARPQELFWRYTPELISRAQASGQLRSDLRPTDIPVLQTMLLAALELTFTHSREAGSRYLGLLIDALQTSRGKPSPLPAPELSPDEMDEALLHRYDGPG